MPSKNEHNEHSEHDGPDAPGMVTKEQAAEMLGRSVRAVARHAAAGRLTTVYQTMPGGGSRAYFDAEEVRRLKDDLERMEAGEPVALERRDARTPSRVTPAGGVDLESLAAVVAEVVARAVANAAPPASPQKGPHLLTVTQAARRAGVTVADIRQAIDAGALPVVTLPRSKKQAREDDGKRIRPTALLEWVDSLQGGEREDSK